MLKNLTGLPWEVTQPAHDLTFGPHIAKHAYMWKWKVGGWKQEIKRPRLTERERGGVRQENERWKKREVGCHSLQLPLYSLSGLWRFAELLCLIVLFLIHLFSTTSCQHLSLCGTSRESAGSICCLPHTRRKKKKTWYVSDVDVLYQILHRSCLCKENTKFENLITRLRNL